MASTNKTTHYELSQYVSSDKPTYLVDYNGDMVKIDTGINAAKTTADSASTAATNAQTAAEGAQTTANTAVTNAATAQTTADGANTKIGTLANLETTEKTNLVGAINEVNTLAGTSEVVDSMTGSEINKAPSVRSIKAFVDGTVLFNGDSAGNITLSDSVANYDELEIYYYNNNSYYNSVKIYKPNLTTFNIDIRNLYKSGTTLIETFSTYNINGTSLSPDLSSSGYITMASHDIVVSFDNTNYSKITKVIGYKL